MTFPALPRTRARMWRTITTIVVVAVMVFLAWVGRPLSAPVPATMAPADGASASYQVEDEWWVSEHAIMNAVELSSSGPEHLAGILSPEDLRQTTTWWRQIDTVSAPDGVRRQLTYRWITPNGDIQLRGLVRLDGTGAAYTPGLPEFPAGTTAGASWDGAGEVTNPKGEVTSWTYSANAATPEDQALAAAGCLSVTSELVEDGRHITDTTIWCPGRGPLPPVSDETVVAPPLDLHQELAWDIASWSPRSHPMAELTSMYWLSHLAPVGSQDAMVLAHQTANDLIDTSEVLARPHPGGSITTLTQSGDVRLVTTSQREAVAYDRQGRPRWRAPLGDAVQFTPIWHNGRVLVTDVSAQVQVFDGATGEVMWRQDLEALPTGPSVWCQDQAFIPTTDGLVALDAATGEPRWITELYIEPTALACLSGAIIVGDDNTLEVLHPDGSRLSGSFRVGRPTMRLLEVGDVLVVVTDVQLLGFQLHGTHLASVWHRDGRFLDAVTDGQHIAALGREELMVIDPAGKPVGSWPMASLSDDLPASLGTLTDGIASIGADQVLRSSW